MTPPVVARACVGAIMKLEEPYIVEWVAWYRLLGFEIVIADHGGDDGQSELLAKLDALGLITRIDVRSLRGRVQEYVYLALFRWAARNGYQFIGFLDADEYLEPLAVADAQWRGSGAALIRDMFSSSSAAVLSFNWMIFGDGKGAPPGSSPVIERFQWSAEQAFAPNYHVKSICHVARCERLFPTHVLEEKTIGVHRPGLPDAYFCHDGGRLETGVNAGSSRELSWNRARIRHYVTKSEKEFREKKARRGEWSTYTKGFFDHHNRNEVFSPLSPEVLAMLRAEIASISAQLSAAGPVPVPPSRWYDPAQLRIRWETRPFFKGYMYSVARRWRRGLRKAQARLWPSAIDVDRREKR